MAEKRVTHPLVLNEKARSRIAAATVRFPRSDSTPATEGSVTRLHLTAPGWLVRVMRDLKWEIRKTRECIEAWGRTAGGGRP